MESDIMNYSQIANKVTNGQKILNDKESLGNKTGQKVSIILIVSNSQ